MRCSNKYYYRPLLLIAVLCVLWATPTQGQATAKPEDQDPTVKSLLREVRLLRQTIQTYSLNSYRSQVIIERIRTSGETVLRLSRALAELRETMEKTKSTIPRMTEQLKVMETTVDAEVDVVKRARLEYEIKENKRSIERYKVGLEGMKEQEQQQMVQLREEQTKLTELENRLDRVEAEMENEIRRLGTEDNRRRP